jgi:hypothetical protein
MHWLTQLYLFGRVDLRLDMRNARPAFTPPADYKE